MPIAAVVAERTEELREICRAHGVRRLDLFGSAAREDFDPETSDLDFLVSFHKGEHKPYAGDYFELLEELERVFGRTVDLVMDGAIDNPYVRKSVDEDRVALYEA